HENQIQLRDSILKSREGTLSYGDTIETYFDDYHMGLVIYRDLRAHDLIGFWDPQGNEVKGGKLTAGKGTVKTPFNPNLIKNFKSESVEYTSGMKNGPVFYYCDCAKVLRKGQFTNNQKEGLWKEYASNGDFIKQKRIKAIISDPVVIDPDPIKVQPDWLQPTHCMMRNPDEKIECPKNL
ncbi:MAG: hypothetical protein ACI837_003459, partial [Crocinitomicaceae bacterium]